MRNYVIWQFQARHSYYLYLLLLLLIIVETSKLRTSATFSKLETVGELTFHLLMVPLAKPAFRSSCEILIPRLVASSLMVSYKVSLLSFVNCGKFSVMLLTRCVKYSII